APGFGLGRELQPVNADVDDALDADQARGLLAGPPAHARDQRVAAGEAPHLLARLVGNGRQLGPRDDRRERPVDVQQHGRSAGVVGLPAAVGAVLGTGLQQRLDARTLSLGFAALLAGIAIWLLV